jgi:glycosyltransferase involved in cell wall biosynthesis/GT2 family glycosyltransferase
VSGAIVFVTTELAPVTPGGAGAVVAALADRLAAEGRDVEVVLVASGLDDAGDRPFRLVTVGPGQPDAAAPTPFLTRSRAAAQALQAVVSRRAVERVEFVDFDGLAHWALTHRADLGLSTVPITVRFHGPVDAMAAAMGVAPPEWGPVRVMERDVFRMADGVVVPSAAVGRLATDGYGLEPDRVTTGQPPLPPLPPPVPRTPARAPEVVCLGRLGEVKGSHDLVAAWVAARAAGSPLRLRFVGADGYSVEGGKPMRAWLEERIPAALREEVRFDPPVTREDLPAALASAWAVVVPSRFESFCLAAHEARALGHPVVVADLPAFADYLDAATGALVYDGSIDGLTEALRLVAADRDLVDELAGLPAPVYGDPLDPYRAAPPAVRHARVQAGLATAAAKRLEVALAEATPAAAEARAARAARAALRLLPAPLARMAVRVVPRAAKERFRRVASWPQEQARRAEAERRRAVAERIARGDFPEVDRPDVTVVIPCFDQGPFLHDALRSVFEQTFASWEVVVVDDGSTDPETVAVLDALDLPRVRVLRQANRGLPGARNAGIRAARGRFVVPLDADDEIAPDFLARLEHALQRAPGAAFAQCWSELFGEQSALWVPRPYNPYQLLLSNSVVGCVLLRRQAWEAVGGYAEDMRSGNEDWDLWLRLLDAGWEQVTVPAPLFRYRKHGVSMSVETEARFERARAAMPARHPRLYAPERVRALKRAHYPWVSHLSTDATGPPAPQDLDDAEVIAAPQQARGKVLVDWTGVRRAAPDTARRLARTLEERPDAYAAVPVDGRGPVAVRRWAVVDPAAEPRRVARVELDADGAPLDPERWRGAWPNPAWVVDPEAVPAGLLLQRQRPEEEGPIPLWLRSAWAEVEA